MEPASIVCGVPFEQAPRDGQREVIERILSESRLNVQLPTGYGKTRTALGAFSVLYKHNKATRCLYVVPSKPQRDQLEKDGRNELFQVGFEGPKSVTDVSMRGGLSIKDSQRNVSAVFVVTVQSLLFEGALDIVRNLMQQGRWMIVVDEYHHYGDGNPWAERLSGLQHSNCESLLAMSATPTRPGGDSAFGKPDVVISYRQAVAEKAVKPLECHSYVYRIEVVENGERRIYTTDEFMSEAGSCSPDDIERMVIDRQMRWSPKYVSPLVATPIARMEGNRCRHGKLQCLITAFCCSHAKLVCEQVRDMFPHLKVDWIGTGENGRSDAENKAVLQRFTPPKKEDGRRDPNDIDVDVLVHVGMAGEGIDCVHVSEVVHLHKASLTNTNLQINGRASRYLPGVTGVISVDSSSPMSAYKGEAIMDAMVGEDPRPDDGVDDTGGDVNDPIFEPLPDQPYIHIWDMECIRIDTEGLATMKKVIAQINGLTLENMEEPENVKLATEVYRLMRQKEAEAHNDKSVVEQWSTAVESALSKVVGAVLKIMKSNDLPFDGSVVGKLKKAINRQKRMECGEKSNDVEILRRHYEWIVSLHKGICDRKEVPSWLM